MVTPDGRLLRAGRESYHQTSMRSLYSQIPDWVKLEHQVQQILTDQETHGWRIDVALARELTQVIQRELEEASAILRDRHPHVGISNFTPLRDNKTKGYFTGCVSTRLTDLNPTSRDHIAWILQEKQGWKPREFTASTRNKEKQKPQTRRESSERDRVRGFYAVHEMFDGNQNAWDAVERRERLFEACYDV